MCMGHTLMTRELRAFAKSIDLCQPAQSEQADMGQNFWLSVNFLVCQRTILHDDSVCCLTNLIVWLNNWMKSCFVNFFMEILKEPRLSEHGSYVVRYKRLCCM